MKNILVVEDEKSLCEAIRIKLEKRGIGVKAVNSAEEAIKFLEGSNNPDLIWLDLRLPRMNGLQFLELMRNNPDWKNKKVIIVSVSGSQEIIEKAKALGIVDYLVKSELEFNNIIDKVIVAA